MSLLDALIGGALVIGAIRGMMTGAVRQLANLVGLVLSFFVAVRLATPFGNILADLLDASPRVGAIVAFLLIFVAIEVALFLLARALEKILGAMRLSTVNRIVGGVAGALKIGLAVSVILVALRFVEVPGQDARTDSVLYYPVASLLPTAWDFVASHSDDVQAFSRKFDAGVRARAERH